MPSEFIRRPEEFFTVCVRVGCGKPATNHPLRCDTHVYRMLPCACPLLHHSCWFAYYDHMQYAKAQRLAREAGYGPSLMIDRDGNPVPPIKLYMPCSECHSHMYALIGTKSQLEGWPD